MNPIDASGWPVEGWRPVSSRPAKAEKPPLPDVCFAVGAGGLATLTLSAKITGVLDWTADEALALEAVETDDIVFLALRPAKDGAFRMQPPRVIVRLWRCGGIALAPRRSSAVVERVEGRSLMMAVPRAGDGTEAKARASRGDKGATGGKAPPAAPTPAPPSVRGGFDFKSLVDRALGLAAEAWTGRTNDRAQRIVAAVALVKLGEDSGAVRHALGLDNTLLPELEDMPNPARQVAATVYRELAEAVEG